MTENGFFKICFKVSLDTPFKSEHSEIVSFLKSANSASDKNPIS